MIKQLNNMGKMHSNFYHTSAEMIITKLPKDMEKYLYDKKISSTGNKKHGL